MVTLYFTKRFTKGTLKGLIINESLTFVSTERAMIWRKGIAAKVSKLGYELIDCSFQNYFRN